MTGLERDVDAATETFDAVDSPRFFLRGRGGRGRPRVRVYRGDRARVVVGHCVAIADDVDFVVGGNHRIDWVTTYPLQEMYDLPDAYVNSVWSNGETHVEHGVAIGRGAKIMPGVHIGIAARVLPFAVVTRDVAAGAVVGGNPAREIGPRFDAPTIDALRLVDWDAPDGQLVQQLERAIGTNAREVFAVAHEVAQIATPTPSSPPSRLGRLAARAREATVRFSDRRAREQPEAPSRVVVGYGSYGDPTVHARDDAAGRLVLGKFCSIATGCEVLVEDADVTLGNDVWLGMGVKVYPGVTLGDGAVAAAWSVVVDDVPPYAVVAGNPARVIKTRFDDETIAALQRIRWWDWSDDRIVANWRALCSADLDAFVHAHDPAAVPDLLPGSAAV